WHFAIRAVRLDYNPAIEPEFGFQRGFDKPEDWIRTAGIAADGYFRTRLTDDDAKDEAGLWYADLDAIYVRFVSNDSAYGGDLARWPQSFANLVEGYLALKISPRLIKAQNQRDDVRRIYQQLLFKARTKDAMNEGAAFPPPGSWAA